MAKLKGVDERYILAKKGFIITVTSCREKGFVFISIYGEIVLYYPTPVNGFQQKQIRNTYFTPFLVTIRVLNEFVSFMAVSSGCCHFNVVPC